MPEGFEFTHDNPQWFEDVLAERVFGQGLEGLHRPSEILGLDEQQEARALQRSVERLGYAFLRGAVADRTVQGLELLLFISPSGVVAGLGDMQKRVFVEIQRPARVELFEQPVRLFSVAAADGFHDGPVDSDEPGAGTRAIHLEVVVEVVPRV